MKKRAGNGRSFGRETLGNSPTGVGTWTRQRGPVVEVLERRLLLSTAPLGTEFRANTYTSGYQDSPSVAMDAAGNFVVAWHNLDRNANTDDGVYWQRFNAAGQRQGAETRANTYTTDVQKYASVGMDAAGNFVVAWESAGQDGSDKGVYAQRYNSTGQPQGAEFRVNSTTAGAQYNAKVAMGAAGDFVIAWESAGAIYAQRYAAAGGPLGSETKVNTQAGDSVISPSVALATDGSFAIVWRNIGGAGPGVQSIRGQWFSASGQKVGGEFTLNASTDVVVADPSGGIDSSGRLTATWSSNGNGTQHIVARQFAAGTGVALGPEFQVDEQPGGSWPRLTMSADGQFVISWSGLNLQSIAYRAFGADGTPAGPELRANSFTGSQHYLDAIASDGAGDFAVVWLSDVQDGDKTGVFGQLYAKVTNPGAVSGVSWADADGNGVRQPGEAGLAGVQVNLLTATGVMAGSALTDAIGAYRFDNLRAGDSYFVQWALPGGRILSPADLGGDDTADSDADVVTGRSPAYRRSRPSTPDSSCPRASAGPYGRTRTATAFRTPVNRAATA